MAVSRVSEYPAGVKIYTKKGDAGQTGLFDGTRVAKSDARIDAYGEVDETNSAIGAARAFLEDEAIDAFLRGIQSDLFAVGAQLADPKYDEAKRKQKTRITEERIVELERFIDRLEEKLPPLKNFILPAGGAQGRRDLGDDGDFARRDQIPEPAVGFTLRGGARGEPEDGRAADRLVETGEIRDRR